MLTYPSQTILLPSLIQATLSFLSLCVLIHTAGSLEVASFPPLLYKHHDLVWGQINYQVSCLSLMQFPWLFKFISVSSSFKVGLPVKTETHKLLLSCSLILVHWVWGPLSYQRKLSTCFCTQLSTDFGGKLIDCGSLSGLKYHFKILWNYSLTHSKIICTKNISLKRFQS